MRTKIGFNNELELAETGVDASGLALGGAALLVAGAVVVLRRRSRA
jgi:LPXTG-motif cell wall-anchored protein